MKNNVGSTFVGNILSQNWEFTYLTHVLNILVIGILVFVHDDLHN